MHVSQLFIFTIQFFAVNIIINFFSIIDNRSFKLGEDLVIFNLPRQCSDGVWKENGRGNREGSV